jgi:hypothetical protein
LKEAEARDKWPQATADCERPEEVRLAGWRAIYAAIQLRMRFAIVLLALAALATGWPWLTNIWERIAARLTPYSPESTVTSGTDYFCPMDPGVVSDWPAICPVCNMDLIRRQKSDSQLLPSGVLARMQLSPYRIALAGVRTVPVQSRDLESTITETLKQELLIPVTAVVYWESETVVYVESMPSMFDAVPIELARREGNSYVIKSGLQPGQRVVAMGTLLVDAESRLHPHLSTQYFGASAQTSNVPPPPIPRSASLSTRPLEEVDVVLADLQRYCPVTKAKLGSMGSPVFVEVVGRRIALCCEGCRDRLLADPSPFLNWLDERLASEQIPK